jgi:HK97 gp10 family phage protein
MAISMKLKGMEKVRSELKQMERGAKNERLREAMRAGGELVRSDARRRAPVQEGDLRDSIQIRDLQRGVEVYSPLIYAPVIEYGWPGHNIEPQPFMRAALYENFDQVQQRIERKLHELMGL